MAFSLHGIFVPHRKNTQDKPVLRMPAPETVTIPLSMHIGTPAKALVKTGDTVTIGQKIAEADGALSSPVYASISGTVKKIEKFRLSDGSEVPAIVIENDGENRTAEFVKPIVDSRDSLIDAIRESGVVGLGGAGFPSYKKLDQKPGKIEYLVLNGAECEPYVTSDAATMTERAEDMAAALRPIITYLGVQNVVIGIESNKKTAIASVRKMAASVTECPVTVKVLPTVYPQGGERVLIYHTTGRTVPVGKLPIDAGCVVLNVTTLASLGRYLTAGIPLYEKCVTVDGGAVKDPANVIVPIGTSFKDLFAFAGGLTAQPAKLLYGGPMMGISVPDDSAPVLKTTNAALALTEKEARLPSPTPCIRCGACTNVCPFGLNPAAIARAYEKKDADALSALVVKGCMECGCCSFVCPANRPLVQTNKLGKAFLKETERKEAQENV